MMTVLATTVFCVAITAAAILILPVTIFSIECLLGVWRARRASRTTHDRPPVAVLIPAHNESAGLASTLENIREQIRTGDRLIVVADNCDDDTAEIAGRGGAEVVVRNDAMHRGKGYALDAGIRYLSGRPCDVVVIVDADCRIEPGALDELCEAACKTGRPVQGRYLIQAPPGARLSVAVAEFAFLVKNHLRPLGLARLGLPCQLTGAGMAFPWAVISQADLATGHLTEDMKLGLDLAAAGHPAVFCNRAVVTSFFPSSARGLETQRQRWEGGHLSMMRFAIRAFFRVRKVSVFPYLALLLDVMVPPLTLLVMAAVVIFAVNTTIALSGLGIAPLLISGFGLVLLIAAVGLAWLTHGRTLLPPRDLMQIPLYAISKLKLYPRVIAVGRSNTWIRTDRGGE